MGARDNKGGSLGIPRRRPAGIEHREGFSPIPQHRQVLQARKMTRIIIQKIEGANRAPRDHLVAEAYGHCRGPRVCHS
jgi:hypothetical protein